MVTAAAGESGWDPPQGEADAGTGLRSDRVCQPHAELSVRCPRAPAAVLEGGARLRVNDRLRYWRHRRCRIPAFRGGLSTPTEGDN